MLVHIRPTCISRWSRPELIDLSIPAFGLTLEAGVHLKLGRPYPNKCYAVAYAVGERKMKTGVLIEAPERLESFVAITRWREGEQILTHEAHYTILDHEFDAVSDDAMLWHPIPEMKFENRWPDAYFGKPPARFSPRLEIDDFGKVARRADVLTLHSLERDRLVSHPYCSGRMPDLNFAFRAAV